MNARASSFRKHAADELQDIVDKAEELLETIGSEGGEAARELRDRVSDTVRVARKRLGKLDASTRKAARQAVESTDEYVHDNPWRAVGIAAGVGLIIGLLIGRR